MDKAMKVTNKVALKVALDVLALYGDELTENFPNVEIAEVKDKLTKMMDALEAKAANAKMTENQKENEAFKVDILEALAGGAKMTASEIWKAVPSLKEHPTMTNQRVSAVLRQMIQEHKVEKTSDKNKTLFYAV